MLSKGSWLAQSVENNRTVYLRVVSLNSSLGTDIT